MTEIAMPLLSEEGDINESQRRKGEEEKDNCLKRLFSRCHYLLSADISTRDILCCIDVLVVWLSSDLT